MTNVISKYQTSLTILKSKFTTCMQTNLKRLLVIDLESDLIEVICCNSWLQTPDKSKQLFPPQTIYHYTHNLVSMSYVIFPLKPSPWSRSDPIFISGPCLLCMGPDFHIWDPIFISGPWCLLCLGPDGDGCVTGWWEVMGINSLLNLSQPHPHHHCHHHQLLIPESKKWIKNGNQTCKKCTY